MDSAQMKHRTEPLLVFGKYVETFHKFIVNIFGKQTWDATAPTCNRDQNISQGGPNGDPILSEMVT